MGYPTRLPFGISTAASTAPFSDYPLPAPFHSSSTQGFGVSTYENDFYAGGTSPWTTTGTSSTFALTSGLGGVAIITPGGTTTATAVFLSSTNFQFIAGQKLWYSCRIKASAVSGTKAFYFGLRNGSGTTDGLWFSKAASSTSLNLVSTVGSTATTLVTGVTTAAADTWINAALYYNGTDLLVYIDGNLVARVESPTIGSSAKTLTDAQLSPVFQITPTATDTLTIDYVLVAQELSR